jgi:hypothetical protein
VAAILPSVAAVDLGRLGAQELKIGILDSLRREVCLAWSPRVLRIRAALDHVGRVFGQAFRV